MAWFRPKSKNTKSRLYYDTVLEATQFLNQQLKAPQEPILVAGPNEPIQLKTQPNPRLTVNPPVGPVQGDDDNDNKFHMISHFLCFV